MLLFHLGLQNIESALDEASVSDLPITGHTKGSEEN